MVRSPAAGTVRAGCDAATPPRPLALAPGVAQGRRQGPTKLCQARDAVRAAYPRAFLQGPDFGATCRGTLHTASADHAPRRTVFAELGSRGWAGDITDRADSSRLTPRGPARNHTALRGSSDGLRHETEAAGQPRISGSASLQQTPATRSPGRSPGWSGQMRPPRRRGARSLFCTSKPPFARAPPPRRHALGDCLVC